MTRPIATAVAPRMQSLLDAELRPGEQAAWCDQPIRSQAAAQVWFVPFFGAAVTAFAVFWMVTADEHKPGNGGLAALFPLLGTPLVLVGMLMVCSPFLLGIARRDTVYAVTNQRALVVRRRLFGRIRVSTFQPGQFEQLERRERADGSGDLVFRRVTGFDTEFERTTTEIGFFGVRNVKVVEQLVLALDRAPTGD